jgi:hypothetical protein
VGCEEWWASSTSGSGAAPSGFSESGRSSRTFRSRTDPHGVAASFEAILGSRSRYSVHGSRPAVSTASRSSGIRRTDAFAPAAPVDFGSPSGHSDSGPAATLRPRRPSWSFPPLQRLERGGPRFPGFRSRFVPPSGFLALLTVCSLLRLPVTRTGAAPGVHPSELFPLPRPYASSAPTTLMPFLTSRASALRTRRSRCPAAPGPCSSGGSVPGRPRPAGRCSPGFRTAPSELLSVSPGNRFPGSSPSCAFRGRSPKRPLARRSRAVPS